MFPEVLLKIFTSDGDQSSFILINHSIEVSFRPNDAILLVLINQLSRLRYE